MTKLPPHALEALTYPSANVSGWIANLIFSTSPPGPTRKSCFVFAVFLATLIPRSRFQRAHSVCTWSSRERFAPRRWPGNGGNWNFYCCSDWKSHWAIQAPARQKIPSVIVVTGSNWLCKTGKIMVQWWRCDTSVFGLFEQMDILQRFPFFELPIENTPESGFALVESFVGLESAAFLSLWISSRPVHCEQRQCRNCCQLRQSNSSGNNINLNKQSLR